jgi:DNA relaxase NicK
MKASVLIDWLSFSVKCRGVEENGVKHSSNWGDVQYIIEGILKLPADLFQSAEYSRFGYRDCVVYNGIEIHYNANSLEMGACVSLSGNSCRVYEQHHTMLELAEAVYQEDDAKVTRIDLACDDKTGVLDIGKIIGEIRAGNLRTRASKKTGYFDLEGKDMGEAASVYIGSAKSEVRFRIYDKAKEQGDYDGIWNRLEGVFRHSNANAVLDAIFTSGKDFGDCVAEIINDKIQFIVQDDSNITRCSIVKWWYDFMETIRRLHLALPEKPKMSMDRLVGYFENISSCVFVLEETFGYKIWERLYIQGKFNAGKRHKQMMTDFKLASA